MSINPVYYLFLSAIIFSIGLSGVLTRRNLMMILLSVELLLNASNLSFVTFSRMHGNLSGQIATLFVIALAAAEVAVGLAIAIQIFRHTNTLDPGELKSLRG